MKRQKRKIKRNFDSWAKRYDETLQKASLADDWMYKDYEKILGQVIAFSRGILRKRVSVVVDIGVGTGNLAQKFVGRAKKIIGIDLSFKMLRLAKKKIPTIETKRADFLLLPLADHSADLIVSSYALHHLTEEEKMRALEEMARVLKKKGKIIIADLMFANTQAEKETKNRVISSGKSEIVTEIEEEYYGHVNTLIEKLTQLKFRTLQKQMTDFVWIICGSR